MGGLCSVDVPQRDIGQETRETIDAQQDAMPRQFELDAEYQPLYSLLGNRNLEATLFGGGGYQNYLTGGGGGAPATPSPRASTGLRPMPGNNADILGVQGAGAVAPTSTDPRRQFNLTDAAVGTAPADTTGSNVLQSVYYPDPDTGIVHTGGTQAPSGATATPIGTIVTRGQTGLYNDADSYRWTGSGWERGRSQASGDGASNWIGAGDTTYLDVLPENYSYTGPGSDGYVPPTTTPPGPTAPGRDNLTGQAGLLDMFENGVTPALTRMQTSASTDLRNATMEDVSRLAPELRANFDAANPESAAMRQQLNELATGGLTAGLTDYETRTAQQASRAAQSARGFGYGGNDAFDEAMGLALDTQQRREANRQFALQVEGANNASSIDPWAAITGQSSQGGAAAAAGGFYRAPAGTQFDPFNAYSSDLFSSNQNAAAAESQANNVVGNFVSNL